MPNLVGTGLNQVPTNGMLGGLAYQSPDNASIKDLDLKNLSQINSEIADTAVDVFVYDTSRDSDGGAWRKRTQHTSWYNETLNTATRGSRKEFPSVAVIVLDDLTTTGRMTIYDGDDPDLPMWMVFTGEGSAYQMLPSYSATKCVCLSALNGKICVGNNTYDLEIIDFLKDGGTRVSTGQYINKHNISTRNSALGSLFSSTGSGLVDRAVNDVAMTVLPNAPIDDTTGLPVPTIAVATDSGVSVFKDDGTVVDLYVAVSAYDTVKKISFTDENKIAYTVDGLTQSRAFRVDSIPSSDFGVTTNQLQKGNGEEFYVTADYGLSSGDLAYSNLENSQVNSLVKRNVAHQAGLSKIEKENGGPRHAFVTTSFNTGWMYGDIKGAFLSDTDATNAVGTELHPNGNSDFSSTDVSYISNSASGTATVTSGELVVSGGTSNYSDHIITVNTVVGQQYVISIDYVTNSGNNGSIGMYVNNAYLTEATAGGGYIPRSTGNTYTWYFTANGTTETIDLVTAGNTSNTYTFDNWTIKAVEEDRSVNNKGLQVFGTVTKSPVATGADLVAYSGWNDATNNLYQPYNSDLDFGTDDFSIMLWANHPIDANANAHSTYISHTQNGGTPPSNGDWILRTEGNTGYLTFYVRIGGAWYSSQYTSSVPASTWYHVVAVRRSGRMYFYIDGREVANSNLNHAVNSTDGIRIGVRYGDTNNYSNEDMKGSMSLLRISGSAPSDEQIKKMYEDEKVLFQKNAKCTLYGSSDAVTALAYDEKTELLHAGTSSGRSDFQGLRRINNTTTAVTTAISAYDGSIAQQ